MNTKNNFVALATAVGLLLSVSVRAELVSTAGGLGVYDNVNNVTWTSNGNLFVTQRDSYSGGASAYVAAVIAASGGVIDSYTLSASDFSSPFGDLSWWGAKAWVHYLNATNYAGASTWALPTTVDDSSSYGPGFGIDQPAESSSQLAQLFYGGLGQVYRSNIIAIHNSSYALFTNLRVAYSSGTEFSKDTSKAWIFLTYNGEQHEYSKLGAPYALAVSPGQVGALSAVPIPGAAWLLGSGLMGMLGLRRKGKQS